jgi:hypothetical protein
MVVRDCSSSSLCTSRSLEPSPLVWMFMYLYVFLCTCVSCSFSKVQICLGSPLYSRPCSPFTEQPHIFDTFTHWHFTQELCSANGKRSVSRAITSALARELGDGRWRTHILQVGWFLPGFFARTVWQAAWSAVWSTLRWPLRMYLRQLRRRWLIFPQSPSTTRSVYYSC